MLCRKCGAQFEGTGIYCPKCLNPAAEAPAPKKVKRQEPKTSRPAVVKTVTSPVFLAALCLMSVLFILLIFAAVPYLNSIDGLFERLGASGFLNKVAPGAKFTVFLGMIPTALIIAGLWVLYFRVKNPLTGVGCISLLKMSVLVKYIYSLSALAFSTLAVFFLSFKWISVFKDLGFTHLLVLGVVSAAGIRFLVNFISARIASESLRNIKEAEKALTGNISSVHISASPIKLTIVSAILNLVLALITGCGIIVFYAVVQIITAIVFGIAAGIFGKLIRSGI